MHPILFRIGPVTIYSYGLMLSLAFLTVILLLSLRAKDMGLKVSEILDLALYLLISGVLGARILHVLVNFRFYFSNPREIIMLTHGGLAYQGGLILAIVVCIWFLKKRGHSFFKTVDLIVPYLALGQSIGRIGCFLNGCCYGRFSTFLGVVFPDKGYPVHPTQLYYSASFLAIFVLLRKLEARKNLSAGKVFTAYLLLYGIVKFLIDFLRDLPVYPIGLTMTQIISICLIAFSSIFYFYLSRHEEIKF
jgi:phosphatidylglycerol---prolipoprotein diacylglyceryl transferase